jgi:NADH:ubiquinone oxidoreductase subunit F (NADH-binding)/(2Fe-2S) ferredoxin
MYRSYVLVCGGTGCTSSGSIKIMEELKSEIKRVGLQDEVNVVETGCHGLCALGPIVVVYPEGTFYSMVKAEDVTEIVEEHLLKGRPVKRLIYDEESNIGPKSLTDTDFFKKQYRIALRNCGVINPEKIDEYIGTGGYEALGKVLTSMKPEEVIDIITRSGLRGRGGAGFPTGRKWQFCAQVKSDVKYVCCNADEGDPGAFMDRSVLEGDPHCVLEAMAIAGYAIGAHQGYIYVRAEYPIAVKRLQIAIDQAHEYGLLGKDIFGTGFDFDIDLRLGAGAFRLRRGNGPDDFHRRQTRRAEAQSSVPGGEGPFRTARPSSTTLKPGPTCPDHSERRRNGSFRSAPKRAKGTKVFALGGKIHNTGLVEIPMGTTLREIIEDIGGGIPNGKKFKAAQTGGPSGGCIPASEMDVPIDYDNLIAIGSMMGSGGMIVMDEDNCMVDIAKFFLSFTVDESCGKCTPCRIGTKRMLEILTKITKGNGTMEDLDRWKILLKYIKDNASAASARLLRTRCFPPCIISRMSTLPISRTRDARPASARLFFLQHRPAKCKGCTLCASELPGGGHYRNREESARHRPEQVHQVRRLYG